MSRNFAKEFRFAPLVLSPYPAESRQTAGRDKPSPGRQCNCHGCRNRPDEIALLSSFLAGQDKKRAPFCDDTMNKKCDKDAGKFIWGCDNRVSGPSSLETIRTTPPWQHIGRLSNGGTGCLIAPTFVLTAAHAIVTAQGVPYSDTMTFDGGFALGQCAWGSRWIDRAWIPNKFKPGAGDKASRCYDWGVVRIFGQFDVGPMAFDAIPIKDIKATSIFSVGYPASLSKVMWSTGAGQKVLDDFKDPGGPGQLLRTTLDGEKGQSGSPVYIFKGNTRIIVGVLVGAPNCAEGANWVSLINDDVLGKIEEVIKTAATPKDMKQIVFKVPKAVPVCGSLDPGGFDPGF